MQSSSLQVQGVYKLVFSVQGGRVFIGNFLVLLSSLFGEIPVNIEKEGILVRRCSMSNNNTTALPSASPVYTILTLSNLFS